MGQLRLHGEQVKHVWDRKATDAEAAGARGIRPLRNPHHVRGMCYGMLDDVPEANEHLARWVCLDRQVNGDGSEQTPSRLVHVPYHASSLLRSIKTLPAHHPWVG